MKAWAFVAAGWALAGCFGKPSFRGAGDDCPDDGSLSVHLDGDRPVVCGPGYRMQFSDRGYGLPDGFTVNDVELAAHRDTCDDGGLFGVGLLPAGVVDGDDPASPTQTVAGGRRAAVELEAPFLIKVAVDWSARFGGCPLAPDGRTTFTFFRGGRIHRHDRISDTSAAQVAMCAPACAEAARSTWELTTFTTFAVDPEQLVTHVSRPDDDDHGPGTTFMQHEACIAAADYTMALHWSDYEDRHLRAPAPGQLAFVQALQATPTASIPADYTRRLHSALVLGEQGEDCAAAERRAASYYDGDPQLMINGSPTGAAHDGIYGGELDDGSTGRGFAERDATLELGGGSSSIPGGWVVWLDFGTPHDAYDVTKAGGDTTGAWFEIHRLAGTAEMLVWFRDPIRVGETITIHPHDG